MPLCSPTPTIRQGRAGLTGSEACQRLSHLTYPNITVCLPWVFVWVTHTSPHTQGGPTARCLYHLISSFQCIFFLNPDHQVSNTEGSSHVSFQVEWTIGSLLGTCSQDDFMSLLACSNTPKPTVLQPPTCVCFPIWHKELFVNKAMVQVFVHGCS